MANRDKGGLEGGGEWDEGKGSYGDQTLWGLYLQLKPEGIESKMWRLQQL